MLVYWTVVTVHSLGIFCTAKGGYQCNFTPRDQMKSSTNKEKEIQREPRRKKEFVKFSVLDSFNSIALITVTDFGYIYINYCRRLWNCPNNLWLEFL